MAATYGIKYIFQISPVGRKIYAGSVLMLKERYYFAQRKKRPKRQIHFGASFQIMFCFAYQAGFLVVVREILT